MRSTEQLHIVLNEQFLPPKEFTNDRLTWGIPAVTDLHDRNTVCTVNGIPGKGYYGDVDVYYNRLNTDQFVTQFTYRSEETITLQILVDALANVYGMDITVDDFVDHVIPELSEGESYDFTLTVDTASLQWIGSIEITLQYGKSWLDAAVGRRDLDVMTHPYTPAPPKLTARLVTWDIDFSAIRDELKPTSRGRYTQWATVKDVCDRIGIPAFLEGSVIDRATADVPDANPAFNRVVIQQSVTSGRLQGPLYFHYNSLAR